MSTGGETKRIKLSSIPKENLNLFLDATRLLGLNFSGIDFISPNICKSYKTITCAINEINRAPGLDAHYFADMKLDNFVAERILKIHFNL
jgi:D-alanine-D-alanine ligase-like ATP-grasp enzyme